MGNDGELGFKTFWGAACDWEPYRMRPVLAELDPSERGKLIPMFLFVDGYEVHRRSEYYAWLWCSGLSMTGSSFRFGLPDCGGEARLHADATDQTHGVLGDISVHSERF